MRKPKDKEIYFEDPIFKFAYMVVLGGTKEEAKDCFLNRLKERENKILQKDSPRATTFFHEDYKKTILIWFDELTPRYSVIAHESIHCGFEVCKQLGLESISSQYDEVLAYYVEWMIESIVMGLQ